MVQSPCHERVEKLLAKGVRIPNPLMVDIGTEVNPDRISGDGVSIHPGCRIHGADTVVSAGVELGAEGPVTLEDCQLGPGVELKGGYFRKSVFLDRAVMGCGAHVREGCLIEEEAGGAHCVGLKQTILFPFVTLGSLINFCDCLMAGGTSRKDHSEVGSSYIHFNFTPDGDKTTPSLFGDVPRGVMLNQPAIFLGGQGGAVGPVRLGFGSVVAAGGILREDELQDGRFIIPPAPNGLVKPRRPHAYKNLPRILRNNLVYLASLVALEAWYAHVRRPFFARYPLGELVYDGARAVLLSAKDERLARLKALAGKVPSGAGPLASGELRGRVARLDGIFKPGVLPAESLRKTFLDEFLAHLKDGSDYISTLRGLPATVSQKGSAWLQSLMDELFKQAADELGLNSSEK